TCQSCAATPPGRPPLMTRPATTTRNGSGHAGRVPPWRCFPPPDRDAWIVGAKRRVLIDVNDGLRDIRQARLTSEFPTETCGSRLAAVPPTLFWPPPACVAGALFVRASRVGLVPHTAGPTRQLRTLAHVSDYSRSSCRRRTAAAAR